MDEFDLSGVDYSQPDIAASLDGIDLGSLDLGNLNAGDFSGLDLSQQDIASALDGINLDDLAATLESDQAAGNINLGGFASTPTDQIDWQSLYNEGLTGDQATARENLLSDLSQYNQDFGGADINKYMDEYQSNLQDIADKGGYTSQWQNVGSDRVMVQDDGSGIGINTETGESYKLDPEQVSTMTKQGLLNTYASGYNEATGGTKIAPGGGTSVTLKNGLTGTLFSDGKVKDDKGTVIGNQDDVKVDDKTKTVGGTNVGGTKTGTKTTQQQNLGSLLPLLLALLAMNKGGSSGSSGATIPSLGASRSQTPYSGIQQAPGYRPGQGGITYFTPMQYMKGMGLAQGGIADLNRGRLLHGSGDGVSDSIPAVIGGMADGGQPARLARGEYVIDARTVAALGNGSTDAGAERLDAMRKKILADDRKAGVGKDSKAYRHLA